MRMLILLMLTMAPALAADSSETYAENLAALRREVETLSSEVETEKEDLRRRLRALETQKTDLEAQIRREELRLAQVDRQVAEQREAAARASVAGEVLTPGLLQAIADQDAAIRAGLPYRVEERLADLDALRTALEAGTLRPQKAASRLWQLAEDELRLTRENLLDRQVIALDGEERMVDVARLGMVALFFRTPEGQVGHVERTEAGWTWRRVTRPDQVERIESLFDALGKQIRVGWFEVPNVLSEAP